MADKGCLLCQVHVTPPHVFCSKRCFEDHLVWHQVYHHVLLIGPQVKRKTEPPGTIDYTNVHDDDDIVPQAKRKVYDVISSTDDSSDTQEQHDESMEGSPLSTIPYPSHNVPQPSPMKPAPASQLTHVSMGKTAGARDFVDVSRDCLTKMGITLSEDRYLSSGSNGSVYLACSDVGGCKAVVKVGEISPSEFFMQSAAGQLGFAPLFLLPPFTCQSTSDVWPRVTFAVMERMDFTLRQILELRRAKAEDARKIAELIHKFFDAGFMHMDLKTDNIMCNEEINLVNGAPTLVRTWKIIDFGLSWYGGKYYGNAHYLPPDNTPYGWDFTDKKLKKPCLVYDGWSRTVLPVPSRDWDLAQLAYYVETFEGGEQQEFTRELVRLALQSPNVTKANPRQWQVKVSNGVSVLFPNYGSPKCL